MRIIVTGATGFIGKHLCTALEAHGHQVVGLSSVPFQGYLSIRSQIVDQIWHLAAWTQAGRFCLDHPAEQWVINQDINTSILRYWRDCQPQAKMISFGTSCAYDPRLPMVEENYLEGRPTDDLMSYAMSKRMLQVGIEAMGKQYGMKWVTIVPSTVYGPGYHKDGRQMHFIFDIVRKVIEAKRTGIPPAFWGDGSQVREVIYASDLISTAMDLADNHEGIFNIGGHAASLWQFVEAVCDLAEFQGDVVWDASQYVGTPRKVLDPRKVMSLYKNQARTPLTHGLKALIAEMSA